jgi:large conductance mechanosensitive channel
MPKPPEVPAEPVEPADVTLLREIRDELKRRPTSSGVIDRM